MLILHCHALSLDRYHLHSGTAGSDSSPLVVLSGVTVPNFSACSTLSPEDPVHGLISLDLFDG